MSEMQPKGEREEKDEKHHEKEEKGRGDQLNAAAWGVIIIWAGLVFFADNLGVLSNLRGGVPGGFVFRFEAWSIIFLGAGVIILLEAAIRVLVPVYRRAVAGTVILGIVFLSIGLGNLISWNIVAPLILIGIGVIVLLRGMGRWV